MHQPAGEILFQYPPLQDYVKDEGIYKRDDLFAEDGSNKTFDKRKKSVGWGDIFGRSTDRSDKPGRDLVNQTYYKNGKCKIQKHPEDHITPPFIDRLKNDLSTF